MSLLEIPESVYTIDVHVIDTISRINGLPVDFFLEPCISGFARLNVPSLSFLVQHAPSQRKVLFDLGVRNDWPSLSCAILE
ncbi:hypothetical protein K432DRAFT_311958 [Lepidopterella palustris CBS 459.81]|uniref:Uncharacterized protein n=1 Tax=Lepidopterella palustris CBS 459.81 TaxID=1314670 RepID=A0A8E2DY47_9PEZI|nr:hypothetical protein K432DRAFT_311958 [Lepidopterella palustris CBS 459.81]